MPLDQIRSVYEDDPDMMEIVREFVADLPVRSAALASALETSDLDTLQTLAHQLKGAGGGYGLQQITDAAGVLEQSLRQGADASLLKDQCEFLRATLDSVVVSEER